MRSGYRELKSECFNMMIEPSAMNAIDDWRFSNRVGSRAEAIRQLIRIGISASQPETKKADAQA